jgi:hypothetical protein
VLRNFELESDRWPDYAEGTSMSLDDGVRYAYTNLD